jgi:hypothetical protein
MRKHGLPWFLAAAVIYMLYRAWLHGVQNGPFGDEVQSSPQSQGLRIAALLCAFIGITILVIDLAYRHRKKTND